jgi:hypothetical protein
VAVSGAKAAYVPRRHWQVSSLRNSHDTLEMAREELDKPLNHDPRFTLAENAARQPRKRTLDAADALLYYFHVLRSGTKGGQGVRSLWPPMVPPRSAERGTA